MCSFHCKLIFVNPDDGSPSLDKDSMTSRPTMDNYDEPQKSIGKLDTAIENCQTLTSEPETWPSETDIIRRVT